MVQPGMPFPNLYRCNKVLVNQKKKVITDIFVTGWGLGMFGTVGWASPHNPKIQGSSPSFVTSAGPTLLSTQLYQGRREDDNSIMKFLITA